MSVGSEQRPAVEYPDHVPEPGVGVLVEHGKVMRQFPSRYFAEIRCDLRRIRGIDEASNTFTLANKSVRILSMTSQLTPKRTTSPAPQTDEASERPLLLQPWFVMALLSMAAIVFVIAAS